MEPGTTLSPQNGVSSLAGFDSLMPADMALKAEEIGVRKAGMDLVTKAGLSVLAGAFIALGALFATITLTGVEGLAPWGWGRAVAGVAFSLGLILVVIGGAELFTGNNLIVMAWASRRITTGAVLRDWTIVYFGNFVGAVATAAIVFLSGHYQMGHGAAGAMARDIALKKVHLGSVQAIASGMLCNALVCMAVWLTYSCRTTGGKIAAFVFPIAAFVAAGFEHCVANMYFVPLAMFIRLGAPAGFWSAANLSPDTFGDVAMPGFLLNNLLPVTIGNIVGGAVMVGAVYWIVYMRKRRDPLS